MHGHAELMASFQAQTLGVPLRQVELLY
jgi:hypothetical protein